MATLNEPESTDPFVPIGAELDQRLREYFRVAHGPETSSERLWDRLAARLEARPASTLGQRGQDGARLLFRRLAGTPSRRRLLGMATAAVLALAVGGATFPFWDRPVPASAEAQAIVAMAQAVSTAPLVPSYHLRAVTSQGNQSESVEEWRAGKDHWRTETTVRDPGGALISLAGTVQNGAHQWAFSTVHGQTHVAIWDLSAEVGSKDSVSSSSTGATESLDAQQLQLAKQKKGRAEATASSSVSAAIASQQALMADAKKRLAASGVALQHSTSTASAGDLGDMSPQDRQLAEQKQRLGAARTSATRSASSADSANSQPAGFDPGSLGGFMKAVSMKLCGTPQQAGSETVAGRAAYKIVITPDANGCPDGRGAPPVGRTIFWLDKQTYMQLKWEQYAPNGTLQARYEVTSLEYDVPIPASTFTYTPSAGATVLTVTKQTPKQDIGAFLNLGQG